MRDEVEKLLSGIGGGALVARFRDHLAKPVEKPLPYAGIDSFAIGYSMLIGGAAMALDLVLDRAFRQEMLDKHSEIKDDAAQRKIEAKVKKRLQELGLEPTGDGQEGMAIDWYKPLNDMLGLKSPYRLRPSNHRILNHCSTRDVIEMLMNGEAGIGNVAVRIFPKMSREAAIELLKLHLDADRTTPASLPLKIMSWLWEQGIKAGNPELVGEPNPVFSMIQGMTKSVDWSKWFNKFAGEGLVPEGANLGEAMLKLYDSGALNQRVFWTSDLGAALGGAKRRALVAGMLELGVEVFAFLEGVKLGHIKWNGDLKLVGNQIKAWREQTKYIDMKLIAQGFAASGGVVRASITGDALQINYFSLGMIAKHLWSHGGVRTRHMDRMIDHSRRDAAEIMADFTASTGISIKSKTSDVTGGLFVDDLRTRLINAGCHSTRVRVLIQNAPGRMRPYVERYEAASKRAEGDGRLEDIFDTICETSYLFDVENDEVAIRKLEADMKRVEEALR